MANPEHVEIVKQGAEVIAQWRKENPDSRLDLRLAELAEIDLRGANLRGADLSGVFAANELFGTNLRRANLSNVDLSDADLRDAELVDANLHDAVLTRTILIRANLQGSCLRYATLRFANLHSVSLEEADLRGADFHDASLRNANLNGASLESSILVNSDLSDANLSGVEMTDAVVGWTLFGNLDLSSVKGLDTVHHSGRSTIGIDTVFASNGDIPGGFLRGCGVPESLFAYLPSLTSNAIEFYSCFISYSHADKSFARRLHDALQDRGIRCWLDEHQLKPGDDIYEHVDRGIRLWDKVLICASEASLTSWWVEREIDAAIEKEQQLRGDRGKQVLAIIPLNLDGHLFKWNGSHAATLRKRLAADFTGCESNNEKFEEQFERVVEALRADDGGREPAPEPKL